MGSPQSSTAVENYLLYNIGGPYFAYYYVCSTVSGVPGLRSFILEGSKLGLS